MTIDPTRRRAILADWHRNITETDELLDPVIGALELEPESPVCAARAQLQGALTRATAELLDDSAEWLEWFHLDNEMGAKGLEAGPGNGAPLRPVRTLEDLAQIMEAQQP